MIAKSFIKTLERSDVTQRAIQSDTKASGKLKGAVPQ